MEKITCKAARSLGLKYYFTGKPCKHGHIAQRLTYKWSCAECAKIYQKEFHRNNPDQRRPSLQRVGLKQREVAWANKDIIRNIYRECRITTKKTGIAHHVDHIVPLKGENVSGLHVHNNLQVLPAPVNINKGNKY